jgi:GTPase SAR1 family protein
MWGTKKKIDTVSNFFEGVNIFKKMDTSLFGKIKQTFSEIFTDADLAQYSLPKVIVIGNESTGKSSLLENITKCQLFPRDSKLCTKSPIQIKLTNGAKKYSVSYTLNGKLKTTILGDRKDIYKTINDYMMSLPTDYISDSEIIVEICDNDMPTFEFWDLPGIRTYPPETAVITTNLCKKYLTDKNAIVLCVVPCTTTRLTSCQSIALITEMGMEANCILALTMVDRLQPENIEELLIKRIIQTSDELAGLNFAEYVAIVNRTHLDTFNLHDHDIIEADWFQQNIFDCIPYEYEPNREMIEQNVCIDKLLNKMDRCYNVFIQNVWKPKILQNIEDKLKTLTREYNSLGSDKIDPHILNGLIASNIKSIFDKYSFNIEYDCKDDTMVTFDAHVYHELREHTLKICTGYFGMTHDQLHDLVKQFFAQELGYKLNRFEKIRNNLISAMQANIKFYTEKEKMHITQMCLDTLLLGQARNNNEISVPQVIQGINGMVQELCKVLIIYPATMFAINFTPRDYEESETYQKKRASIKAMIENTQKHHELINNLGNEYKTQVQPLANYRLTDSVVDDYDRTSVPIANNTPNPKSFGFGLSLSQKSEIEGTLKEKPPVTHQVELDDDI